MEYYGLRKSGEDIDLIATEQDVASLIRMYPTRVKNLSGDLGVCPLEFEIWKTICFFDYSFYKQGATEKENYLIVSIEKLLFMKTLAINEEKYINDVKLIVQDILKKQNELYEEISSKNRQLLGGVNNIIYIERTDLESK